MRIAIIGSAGAGIGRVLARAGHTVLFTGSRDPKRLAQAAERAGPNASTAGVPDAVAGSEVVVLAVPFERVPGVAREAGDGLRGKVVVDATNPIAMRDGRAAFLQIPEELTAAQFQETRLPDARVVKAFNTICPSSIHELTTRTGGERAAVLLAGDDVAAKQTVAGLIADANLVPIDVGNLADAGVLEPTSVGDRLWSALTEREARRLVRDRTARRVEPEERRTDGAA